MIVGVPVVGSMPRTVAMIMTMIMVVPASVREALSVGRLGSMSKILPWMAGMFAHGLVHRKQQFASLRTI
jgi:hypothetical protein